jgi:protein-S-isoprenylcysteine O-methyltransferase Ste14
MTKMKYSILGIGGKLAFYTSIYAGFAAGLSLLFPNFFFIRSELVFGLRALGFILLAMGIILLIISVRQLLREFQEGILMTGGVFRYLRNPIYAAWTFLIIPALSFFTLSWLFFFTPFIFYLIFKTYIREEEEFLEGYFGDEYIKYKAKTGQLLPRFRFSSEQEI